MRLTVYIPRTLTISESEIPALTAAARRRFKLPPDRPVSARHIIEEARRAGLIDIGKDYCVDLDADPLRRGRPAGRTAASQGSNNGTRGGIQRASKG